MAKGSHATRTTRAVPADRRTSCTNRDLPMPGSPSISTHMPCPPIAPDRSAWSVASSSARPTKVTSVIDVRPRPTTRRPTTEANCGWRLPLTRNGSSGCRLERCRRALDGRPAGDELARRGLGHQPGCEVHGVTHHRVHASPRRADLTGEHVTGVDADAHRQADVGVEQGATDREHASLTVFDRIGSTGRQDDLHAAGGCVGCEQTDLVAVGEVDRHANQFVEALGDRRRCPNRAAVRRRRRRGRSRSSRGGARRRGRRRAVCGARHAARTR